MAHETAARPALNASGDIKHFILERYPLARKKTLSDTDLLLESGILDSLGILDLVAFLEQRFHVVVSDEDLVPENFQSVQQIAAFVCLKAGSSN